MEISSASNGKVLPPFPRCHLRFLKLTVQMALFSGALYHSEHQSSHDTEQCGPCSNRMSPQLA